MITYIDCGIKFKEIQEYFKNSQFKQNIKLTGFNNNFIETLDHLMCS